MDAETLPPLPLMRTMEEAMEICEREQDNFYVTAFMLEAWLGAVPCGIVDEFSGKRPAGKRRFQTGMAADLDAENFGNIRDEELEHFFNGDR